LIEKRIINKISEKAVNNIIKETLRLLLGYSINMKKEITTSKTEQRGNKIKKLELYQVLAFFYSKKITKIKKIERAEYTIKYLPL
jgi:hypothetical protein